MGSLSLWNYGYHTRPYAALSVKVVVVALHRIGAQGASKVNKKHTTNLIKLYRSCSSKRQFTSYFLTKILLKKLLSWRIWTGLIF
jgi:hypothetical protein